MFRLFLLSIYRLKVIISYAPLLNFYSPMYYLYIVICLTIFDLDNSFI